MKEPLMKHLWKTVAPAAVILALIAAVPLTAAAQEENPTAELPVLIASCGQSPGPSYFNVFLRRLGYDYTFNTLATAQDLRAGYGEEGVPYKTLIVVTGASLKGMGAAGISIEEELARTGALIDAAGELGVTVIGAHIEGMERRAQNAAPGDNSDELSIDAVCPRSDFMIVLKEGDEDDRFSIISEDNGIPLILYEMRTELNTVLQNVFGG
jgi:hypothetical protein